MDRCSIDRTILRYKNEVGLSDQGLGSMEVWRTKIDDLTRTIDELEARDKCRRIISRYISWLKKHKILHEENIHLQKQARLHELRETEASSIILDSDANGFQRNEE
ncbi:hypothetical protein HAX54_003505 [Datura stramonium]|uniref:Uncharacterized protein n=1 Tax=Datura stramonium TaxID=4076 RepID=A0ABS8RTF5_DATST|nr:hypothetical protein [Datura stramonium]